jgi:hypothetical protein
MLSVKYWSQFFFACMSNILQSISHYEPKLKSNFREGWSPEVFFLAGVEPRPRLLRSFAGRLYQAWMMMMMMMMIVEQLVE